LPAFAPGQDGAGGRALSGRNRRGDPLEPTLGGEKAAHGRGGAAANQPAVHGWRTEPAGEFGARYDVRSSRDLLGRSKRAQDVKAAPRTAGKPAPSEAVFDCLGIRAGRLGQGEWVAPLPACEPGREYLFTADFYQDLANTPAYPIVSLWGRRKKLDSHWQGDAFQRLRAYVRCPEGVADPTFRFVNELPGKEVWMGRPSLVPLEWPLGEEPATAASPASGLVAVHAPGPVAASGPPPPSSLLPVQGSTIAPETTAASAPAGVVLAPASVGPASAPGTAPGPGAATGASTFAHAPALGSAASPGTGGSTGPPPLQTRPHPPGAAPASTGFFYPHSFPIGVYGASPENWRRSRAWPSTRDRGGPERP
jgi:hypothetical protein